MSAESATIPASAIDGLLRAVPHPDALRAALRSLGVTPERLQHEYPAELFHQVVLAVAANVFQDHSPDDAQRAVGHRFTVGFLQTIIGRLVAVSLPWITAEQMLQRVPRYLALGQRGLLRCAVRRVGPRAFQVSIQQLGGVPVPHFMAGCIEAGLERTRTPGRVEVVSVGPAGYELRASW